MAHYAQLWLFFLQVFPVILLPGMDMSYILGSALTGGRRLGFLALAGIMTGGLCHMVAGVLGIGVVLRIYPPLFRLMLLAGTAYLVWIGISILRNASALRLETGSALPGQATVYRRGLLTNLLNPRAYLFTLAVFPLFLRPEYGPLWLEGTAMWLIVAVCELTVYGAVVLAAGKVRAWLEGDPQAMRRLSRAVGLMLMSVALINGLSGWLNP